MGTLKLLLPDLSWLKLYSRDKLSHDFMASLIAAVLALPQGVALAAVAGLPPEYGLYGAVFPVIIAALWGSSHHALGGPNLAASLIIISILPIFGNLGSELYISLALVLALVAGLFQVTVGLLKLGYLLDYISPTVIAGVINAVGILMVTGASFGVIGYVTPYEDVWQFKVWHLLHEVTLLDPLSTAIGLSTLVVGLLSRFYFRRFWLVFAMIFGSAITLMLRNTLGLEGSRVEFLGNVSIDWIAFTQPTMDTSDFYVLRNMLLGGISIALVGMLQAGLTSRLIADKSGQHIDVNREVFSQGLHNIAASFLHGIAGATSTNRSLSHYNSGAKTPVAGILSAVFLLFLLLMFASYIAWLPMPVIAAAMVLVGINTIHPRDFNLRGRSGRESLVFYFTLCLALFAGLVEAVLWGVAASAMMYMKSSASLRYTHHRKSSQNQVLHFSGNLYFGSLRELKRLFEELRLSGVKFLEIDVSEVGVMDYAVRRALNLELQQRQARGCTLAVIWPREETQRQG